jgi:hypothetical protein
MNKHLKSLWKDEILGDKSQQQFLVTLSTERTKQYRKKTGRGTGGKAWISKF